MELTSGLRKSIAALSSAKHRREQGAFVAEGTKCVLDTLQSFGLRYLVATRAWLDAHKDIEAASDDLVAVATPKDMERMTSLSTAPQVIAVYSLPEWNFSPQSARGNLLLALDGVQDPGNLGTIIRAADWFGVRQILCSEECADAFSPKTVMATMGAISRVEIFRGNLSTMIQSCRMPVMGTFLDGDNIYTADLPQIGILVMGNEGRGIGEDVGALVTRRLLIPSYPADAPTSESLNVGMATSVALAEIRRRVYRNG